MVPPPDQRPKPRNRLPANALAEREAQQKRLRDLARYDASRPGGKDGNGTNRTNGAARDRQAGETKDPAVAAASAPPDAASTSDGRARNVSSAAAGDAPGPTPPESVPTTMRMAAVPQDLAVAPHAPDRGWSTPDGLPPLPRPPALPPAPATSRPWPERILPWLRDDPVEGRCVSCGSPLTAEGTCPLGHAG